MRWLLVGMALLIAVGSAAAQQYQIQCQSPMGALGAMLTLQCQVVQVAAPPPPAQSPCKGVIDMTAGCVMPMLGGAP